MYLCGHTSSPFQFVNGKLQVHDQHGALKRELELLKRFKAWTRVFFGLFFFISFMKNLAF